MVGFNIKTLRESVIHIRPKHFISPTLTVGLFIIVMGFSFIG